MGKDYIPKGIVSTAIRKAKMKTLNDMWVYADGFAICPLDVPSRDKFTKARAIKEKCETLACSAAGAQIGKSPMKGKHNAI